MRRGPGDACLTVCAAALLAGCAVGPAYHRPAVAEPARWSGAAAQAAFDPASNPAATLGHWWRQFHDAELDHLVQTALTDNLDIESAAARIAQARAERDVAAGAAWPTLAASVKDQRYRVPDDLQRLPQQLQSAAPGAVTALTVPRYLSVYQLGFDTSWELDLFGATRRSVESANASAQAAVAARRGVVVATLAELGNDYLTLRATQARLRIVRHTLDTEQLLLELTQSRQRSGLASELDVAQAQAQLETTRATPPMLRAQVLQSIHALAVLLGRPPEDLEQELSADRPLPESPPAIPVGLPSELLENRPDIQQAERALAAATAAVGVARAQRFPSLSLTGGSSLVSTQLNELVKHASWTWNLGGSLTAPLFEGGRLAANERAAAAAAEQSRLLYRQTVLQAFRETEDALQSYAAALERTQALQSAAQAQQVELDRATQTYRAGLDSYIDVLDADRGVAAAQDQLELGRQQQLSALVAIYKALGGGWQEVR
ncbi:MAG TPA: efflux transporter outer membrane subunit [Steroidobacteraceae bacterium]